MRVEGEAYWVGQDGKGKEGLAHVDGCIIV